MSRIETGNRRISTADVATLCAIYRLPLAQRERLIEAARTGNPITSGDGMIAGTPAEMSTLASYEADAIRITDCSMTVVPGLLQTRDYAVGMMSTGRTDFGDPEGAVAETGAQANKCPALSSTRRSSAGLLCERRSEVARHCGPSSVTCSPPRTVASACVWCRSAR
jgi:hypothetical protein